MIVLDAAGRAGLNLSGMTSSPREKKLEENRRIIGAIEQREDCRPGAGGQIVCPKCGGTIAWSYKSKHLRAKCATPGCLSGCLPVRK
jgi:hypothetical protein